MPANLENSAVATGLEKVSFHSNPSSTTNELRESTLLKNGVNKPYFQMFRLVLEKAE